MQVDEEWEEVFSYAAGFCRLTTPWPNDQHVAHVKVPMYEAFLPAEEGELGQLTSQMEVLIARCCELVCGYCVYDLLGDEYPRGRNARLVYGRGRLFGPRYGFIGNGQGYGPGGG